MAPGNRPVERHPVARSFLQRRTVGTRGCNQGGRIASLLANYRQNGTERLIKVSVLSCRKTSCNLKQVLQTFSDRLENYYEVSSIFFRRWPDSG
jgi:hypothetical protein